MGIRLSTEQKVPQLLSERGCLLLEEPGNVQLDPFRIRLWFGLSTRYPQRDERGGPYKSLFLQHPEDKINDDVVLGVENLDNSLGNPSVRGSQGQFVYVTGGPGGGELTASSPPDSPFACQPSWSIPGETWCS